MSEPLFNGQPARVVRNLFHRAPPDPWRREEDAAVQAPGAVALCVNCLAPQPPHRWFCPECAYPTGEFVATMPYLTNYVIGEALRQGVMGPPQRRISVLVFLALFATTQYSVFAPVYWYWMLRRLRGRPICQKTRSIRIEEPLDYNAFN